MLTAAELHSLASASYGARWQSPLAREMGIALRTVQRWAADGIHKPATAEGVRRFLEERRLARIAPPPAGESYTAANAAAALEQALAALVAAAVAAGWRPAEVFAGLRLVLARLEAAADPEG